MLVSLHACICSTSRPGQVECVVISGGGMSRRLCTHWAEGLGGFIAGGIIVARVAHVHMRPRERLCPRAPNLLPALSVPPSVGGADLGALLCDGLFAGGTRHCVLGRRGTYLYTNMHAVHYGFFNFPFPVRVGV